MKKHNRIQQLFQNRKPDHKIMTLFITAGYPDPSQTVALLHELEDSGADMIELGMPFSDPLADGPTIQHASNIALAKGVHLEIIFQMVREFRRNSETPIVLMGYINPVLRYGLKAFVQKASESGVDGIIIPDAPPGELPELAELSVKYGIAPIYLVAPNTTDERMRIIDKQGSGFIYCVSVTGVTGARDGDEVNRSVEQFIQRVRSNVTKNPVLIGFGIRSHKDAMSISKEVEGFIVGSALIDVINTYYPDKNWIHQAGAFVKSLCTGREVLPSK